MMLKRWARTAASIAVALLVATACSSASGQRANQSTPASSAPSSGSATSATAGTPVSGGSITVGQFSALSGFDPALNPAAGHGAAGGIELAALYDTLMRWNPDTRKVEPRTAASMLPNVDSTQWTLKLRPGIKFSDGTDYDANTVKFNVERSLAPSSGSGVKPILQTFLASTTVVDPLTVTFTLKQPWTGFSFLFTGALGLVASPAAIQKAGDNFNTSPGDAGAGPFVLSSFKPGESVVFKRNPHYWDGSVYLDQVTFELFNGAGATYLGLKTGILQAGLLREPATIEMARSANFSMLTTPIAAGNMALFNSGAPTVCKGGAPAPVCIGQPDGKQVASQTPTVDSRVRRAVAAALDPNQINQRVYHGKARVGTALFASDIPGSPNVAGPQYDRAQARNLVHQAMTAGWDGKIQVLSTDDPTGSTWGQTVMAMLQAVGMQVDLTTTDVATSVQRLTITKDFEIVNTGLGFSTDPYTNFTELFLNFYSTANRFGYSSAGLDAGIDALRVARNDAEVTAAYKQIADVIDRDVPFVPLAEITNAWVFTPKLHGAQLTSGSVTLLDKAWLSK